MPPRVCRSKATRRRGIVTLAGLLTQASSEDGSSHLQASDQEDAGPIQLMPALIRVSPTENAIHATLHPAAMKSHSGNFRSRQELECLERNFKMHAAVALKAWSVHRGVHAGRGSKPP